MVFDAHSTAFNGANSRSVVVINNASIHHIDKVVTTIQAAGAILRTLEPRLEGSFAMAFL